MKIKTQDYNDIMVVELQGDLDADFTEPLQNTIADIIAAHKAGVVLDMSGVGFIDSAGLEHLLSAAEHCSQNNCQFRLAGLDENCQKILEITGLDNSFSRYAELAEAVKSLA